VYNGKLILGLIPARGGSKGLPRKNIRPLYGKPLIAWTIEQARASRYLDAVVVTTDDAEIADIARRFGADVPFMRPAALASDTATSMDVMRHALDHFAAKDVRYDYLVLLEPTSPLRETSDIDTCITILIGREDAEAIVSIAKLESAHPDFNVVLDSKSSFIRNLFGNADFASIRRQDLRDVFFFDGTLYCSRVDALLAKGTFYHDATLGYPVPKWKSIEIDDLSDFLCAETLVKARQEGIVLEK